MTLPARRPRRAVAMGRLLDLPEAGVRARVVAVEDVVAQVVGRQPVDLHYHEKNGLRGQGTVLLGKCFRVGR